MKESRKNERMDERIKEERTSREKGGKKTLKRERIAKETERKNQSCTMVASSLRPNGIEIRKGGGVAVRVLLRG